MKRVLALILVLVTVFTLTACKSKEQRAADKFLKKMETLVDDSIEAFENKDTGRLQELQKEIDDLGDDYKEIFEALKEKDPDEAEAFANSVVELGDKLVKAMK